MALETLILPWRLIVEQFLSDSVRRKYKEYQGRLPNTGKDSVLKKRGKAITLCIVSDMAAQGPLKASQTHPLAKPDMQVFNSAICNGASAV